MGIGRKRQQQTDRATGHRPEPVTGSGRRNLRPPCSVGGPPAHPGGACGAPLSDRTLDARALAAPRFLSSGREILSSHLIATIATTAILLIAATDAALRGPWLDEFWTVQLSDTRAGLAALVRDGWLRDAHPPLFNALATGVASLLSSLGLAASIPAGRLAANLPAAAFMLLAAWRVARHDPAHAPFGGYKKSGFGRENHKMMLGYYRQTKNMLISYDKNKLGFF